MGTFIKITKQGVYTHSHTPQAVGSALARETQGLAGAARSNRPLEGTRD
eukprot:SAG31_NODE_5508_length_2492_cov_2.149603_2_plen_49_part_00